MNRNPFDTSDDSVVETPATVMQPEKLSEQDLNTLREAIVNAKLARLTAEKSIAENNAADLSHRYIVLQLFVKYGLALGVDSIDDAGTFVRGTQQ
jgi:hypothetical protein